MYFLSIDFGTSAVKMSVTDENANTISWAKQDYPYILLPGEKVEMNPDVLMNACFTACQKLDPELRSKIEYVCYDTFSPSPVFMDKAGDLVYPNIITHLDRRSRAQSDYIDKLMGKDNYMNISGIYPFAGGCSAMTLIWFKQNEPEVFDRTYRIGHLPTFIHKKFTGEWMVDLVNASMLGLYETTTQGSWSKELLKAFDLKEDWFGEIMMPGKQFGTLLPEIADKMGLKAGLPVAIGTNDVAAAQMGAGNKKAGDIMNTTGSSEMVSILTDKPVVNPHYYLRNAALPGLWQIYSTTAGGFAVDWFYNQFCKDVPKSEYYGDFIKNAVEKYMSDTEVTFDPYLSGDRQSLEKKTASWHGLTLGTTREQMLVAVMRAIQSVLGTTIREASEVLPLNPTIKISGGMATPHYLKLKAQEIPGYNYQLVDDCPIKGNVELVKYYQNK